MEECFFRFWHADGGFHVYEVAQLCCCRWGHSSSHVMQQRGQGGGTGAPCCTRASNLHSGACMGALTQVQVKAAR